MDTDKPLLFVGGIFTNDRLKEILSKSKTNPQMAANNFQWGLIRGFDDVLSSPVTILNEIFVGSFPKNYKDPIILSRKFSHTKNARDIELGFVNICYIKQLLKPFREKTFLRNWINENPEGNVFIYALTKRSIRIAQFIKSISPKTKIIVSVNDLPQHIMKSGNGRILVRMWKDYQTKVVYRGLKYIDGFMLVAERQYMALNTDMSKCVIVEAVTDKMNYEYESIQERGSTQIIKNIVYTGTLALQYNIMNLVNAFMQINDKDIRLIICGDGEAREIINKKSNLDNRIKYLGVLSKDEVYKIQKKAWVLVNPRNKGQEFTDYSFPIKTIDYLAAGRPVICQKLEAIPNEYDSHLIYYEIKDNDEGLVDALKSVLKMNIHEIELIGRNNINFVNKYKTPNVQAKRILNLYEHITTGYADI